MEALSQQEISKVLSKYAYSIKDIKCINDKDKKGVWWITSSNNNMILKKMSGSEATIKFILSATNYLISKGCRLPKILKNTDNNDYTNLNKNLYVLYEGLIGNKIDDGIAKERQAIIGEMGKFHRASAGFIPPVDSKPKNHLGTWTYEYSEYVEMLKTMCLDQKNKTNLKTIDKIIIREFPYFYRRAIKAIDGLKGQEYENWVNKLSKTGGLCHQDFSTANLLRTDKGIYIIDTDSLTIDLPARDIRKLLNKIMKKTQKWDLSAVSSFIEWYNSQNKLTNEEWKVVMYDLMFPHLFLGAVHKYYFQRDTSWTEEDYLNRINEMISFEKTINPILDHYNVLSKEVY